MTRVAIFADDLTGAADCGVQFTRAGYRTAVVFRGERPPEGTDAVVMDTDSRALEPLEARERVREAFAAMGAAGGYRIAYKKLDSTLRGPVAAELEAALSATGRRAAIVAPAFPDAGRTTLGGVQMVHGTPVHETSFADDPRTPVPRGHIPSLLKEAGLAPVRALGVEEVSDEHEVSAAVGEPGWVVADAGEQEHLKALVRSVPDPSSVLWAGSAGLALALGRAYPGPHLETARTEGASIQNALVVVGSVSGVAREQLHRLADEPDVASVPLDSRRAASGSLDEAVGEAVSCARDAFEKGLSVALYSTSDRETSGAGLIADALARAVAVLSEDGLVSGLVLTGGDTAVRVSRALGASGVLLEGEVEAGVPFGTLAGPKPYPVVTKAGGFGSSETLLNALRALTGGKEESVL